jgi:hypothetical protein
MNYLEQAQQQVAIYIDFAAVLLVLLGGFFSKRYLSSWKIDTAFKTLLMGTFFIAGYMAVLHLSGDLQKQHYAKYFVSYCVATSLYEIILKRFLAFIKDKKQTI